MKSEKIIKSIFISIFLIIIFFFMITTIFNNEKVSETERRNLTTFPKFSFKNLLANNYYDTLTTAFNDQLEFRDYLVKGYFLFQFQRYYGDVVEGKNGELYTASQKEVMIWTNKIPEIIRGYVRNLYLERPNYYLNKSNREKFGYYHLGEIQKKKDEASAVRFRQFVQSFNKRFRKDGEA